VGRDGVWFKNGLKGGVKTHNISALLICHNKVKFTKPICLAGITMYFYVMRLTALLLSIFIWGQTFAQPQVYKRWDKRYGGTYLDEVNSLLSTPDGGFLLSGSSSSRINGDKTQDNWDTTSATYDYWIVKVDSLGNKQWDKRYGGTDNETFYNTLITDDGGYLLAGVSVSDSGGDKTEFNWDTHHLGDYWIVRIDESGNTLWDRHYGGFGYDELRASAKTKDGGFILAGYTDADAGGDITEANRGSGPDYWIIKIDSVGNKQWDKRYGGTSADYLSNVIATDDGGFVLAGRSVSGIGGDKTQPNWDVATGLTMDYWIIKIDSLGNKQWDKRYGGTNDEYLSCIQQTEDGFIIGGWSGSRISGDVSENGHGIGAGSTDYWIIKIDSSGVKQWDKKIGGNLTDILYDIQLLSNNGGYLLSGVSRSNASDDKSEDNTDIEDGWIVKIDTTGNVIWDKTLKANSSPTYRSVIRGVALPDSCYVITYSTITRFSDDKTQDNWDTVTGVTRDFWMIKFCENEQLNTSIYPLNYDTDLLSIFPNPTTNKLTCTLLASLKQVYYQVLSIDGKVLINNTAITQPHFEVDVSELASGVYYLVLQDDKERTVKRFVKY